VNAITGKPAAVEFVECDVRDRTALDAVFIPRKFESVIHFAGYKAVGESRQKPLLYYSNNLAGSLTLLDVMAAHGVKNLVFSSSCTVYGNSPSPLAEDASTGVGVTNAYARTKFMIEEALKDVYAADTSWRICMLRYFNPVGAHPSGSIGEDPCGIPNCLMPYVLQVLVGRLEKLTVFGDDYNTPDGTCLRDFIHVVDVGRGHLDALNWMGRQPVGTGLLDVFNFGTGNGVSVRELITAMERASGRKVPYAVGPRRNGDLQESFCVPDKAARVLGWKAMHSLDEMCKHAWAWQSTNPHGFGGA
jgi:UDP-glucose 4-epimerase